ncbi:MAG: hypothetical protein KC435_04215 [Thermomicrobiales bacterium]|nr:hypothetical protein [Thermomicrobiales bacterium]
MEPRPQKPRPQTPPAAPQGTQPTAPDPTLHTQHTQQFQPQAGYDPSAFVAPARMEYDYSPLDLQPPGQRRKRQIIAGIIGALVVVAIGALIVAGWMALRDDDKSDDIPPTNDRVAELNATATATETDDSSSGNETTTGTDEPKATEKPSEPTAVPTTTSGTYTSDTLRTVLPVVESMPGDFVEAGDTPQDLDEVVSNLGGGDEVESMLTGYGWQGSRGRKYDSSDPATTGSTSITVSVHAFKDTESAQGALNEFATILQSFGWTATEGETYGDGSQTFTFSDTESDSVSIYVVKDNLLYRVFATGPTGFDSTDNAIYVVEQILAN